jgi:hypothetical protein
MNSAQFLNESDVAEFISWLVPRLDQEGSLPHIYEDRKCKKTWKCTCLHSAFEQYAWRFSCKTLACKGETFSESRAVLEKLRQRLLCGLSGREPSLVAESCIGILQWGGVRRHNVEWVKAKSDQLMPILGEDAALLQDAEPTLDSLTELHRFNAGFSKIYSLLLDDFLIIYDGRVGAALGALVRDWCRSTARQKVPELLGFPWSAPKEDKGMRKPKQRNPSVGELIFPRIGSEAHHALWAVRASWLLKSLVASEPNRFSIEPAPLRALEAALFMVGYHLWPAS